MSWAVLPRPMSSAKQAPSPSLPRNASQPTPRAWYSRSVPLNPGGFEIDCTRACCAWSSNCPSHPVAVTPCTGMSPRLSPSADATGMPTDMRSNAAALALCDRPTRAMTPSTSDPRTSTHCPRSRTRERRAAAAASSVCRSAFVNRCSPSAASQRKSTSSSNPNPSVTTAPDRDAFRVVALARSPSRRRPVHQEGRRTVTPESVSGPTRSVSSSATVASSRSTLAGTASSSSPASSGATRVMRARSASRARPASASTVAAPAHHASSGMRDPGSSTSSIRTSTTHGSANPSRSTGSWMRKHNWSRPTATRPERTHSTTDCSKSRARSGSNEPSSHGDSLPNAVIQASGSVLLPGRRGTRSAPATRARTCWSTATARASAMMACDAASVPGRSARRAARSLAAGSGHHQLRIPVPSTTLIPGTNRPASTRATASSVTSASSDAGSSPPSTPSFWQSAAGRGNPVESRRARSGRLLVPDSG